MPKPAAEGKPAKKKKAEAFKIPVALGACADLLYTTRQDRLALQAQIKELEERESLLREHIIRELPKSQAGGIAGRIARATVNQKVIPRVLDWEAFEKFCLRNKTIGFLQRRVNDSMVQEIWDAKKSVPGVEPFTVISVGLNKI
jgi:hypothetical protein